MDDLSIEDRTVRLPVAECWPYPVQSRSPPTRTEYGWQMSGQLAVLSCFIARPADFVDGSVVTFSVVWRQKSGGYPVQAWVVGVQRFPIGAAQPTVVTQTAQPNVSTNPVLTSFTFSGSDVFGTATDANATRGTVVLLQAGSTNNVLEVLGFDLEYAANR